MPIYAIGDIHGQYDLFCRLLDKIEFSESQDQLWIVGDMVNRGPDSLKVCQLIRSLKGSAISILGNHDIHLIVAANIPTVASASYTFSDILESPERDEIIDWMRNRPFLHRQDHVAMIHAGMIPQWTLDQAEQLAKEAENAFKADNYQAMLPQLYGNCPDRWSEELTGIDRIRYIINVFTRLRFCKPDSTLDFQIKGEPDQARDGYLPWYDIKNRKTKDDLLITGHWSALGLRMKQNHLGIDTGACWGRALTAVRLGDRKVFQVEAVNKAI